MLFYAFCSSFLILFFFSKRAFSSTIPSRYFASEQNLFQTHICQHVMWLLLSLSLLSAFALNGPYIIVSRFKPLKPFILLLKYLILTHIWKYCLLQFLSLQQFLSSVKSHEQFHEHFQQQFVYWETVFRSTVPMGEIKSIWINKQERDISFYRHLMYNLFQDTENFFQYHSFWLHQCCQLQLYQQSRMLSPDMKHFAVFLLVTLLFHSGVHLLVWSLFDITSILILLCHRHLLTIKYYQLQKNIWQYII